MKPLGPYLQVKATYYTSNLMTMSYAVSMEMSKPICEKISGDLALGFFCFIFLLIEFMHDLPSAI